MKRILLTGLTAIVFGFAYGQSIQITGVNSNVIPNGTIADYWVDMNSPGVYEDFPIKNISSGSKYIKCRRYEITVAPGSSNLLCWLACYSPGVGVSPSVNMPASTSHLFTSHYYPNGNAGTTTLNYTFWDSLNPADSAWFTVRWNATPAGVNNSVLASANISNIYPNPASVATTISYQLNNADNAVIRVYNLLGDEVKHLNISAKEFNVTFSVTDLEAGIYFCSFISGDKVLATRKLTVAR